MTGEEGQKYAAIKNTKGQRLLDSVASDIRLNKTGGGGCHWAPEADASTAKCVPVNPKNPAYAGFAQPKEVHYIRRVRGGRLWDLLRLRLIIAQVRHVD
jgi:hypothetical protein